MDDEVKGKGNSVNYKYRMHDPRIGKFFAIDPLAPRYPYNSPYAFSENVVINAIELEGLEKWVVIFNVDTEGIILSTDYMLFSRSGMTQDATMTPDVGIVYFEKTGRTLNPVAVKYDNTRSTFYGGNTLTDRGATEVDPTNPIYEANFSSTPASRGRQINAEIALDVGAPYVIDQVNGGVKKMFVVTSIWNDEKNYNFGHDEDFLEDADLVTAQADAASYAQILIDNPGLTIKLEAHTSTLGSEEYNADLSQRRADFLRELIKGEALLLDPSFQDSRIETEGIGEGNPIWPNDNDGLGKDASEQRVNRRVGFKFKNNSTTSDQ